MSISLICIPKIWLLRFISIELRNIFSNIILEHKFRQAIEVSVLLLRASAILQLNNRHQMRRNIPSPMSISFLYAFLNSEKMNCVEDPQNNLGGIYVGSLESANDRELLRKNGIKAVLTVASGTGLSYPKDADIIEHVILPSEDIPSFDISKHFEAGIDFIERNRKLTNVLVHCHAGISRSSTIALAYLMKTKGWKCDKALAEVRKRRQIISPNPGFLKHLLNFEKKLMLHRVSNENKTQSYSTLTKPATRPAQLNTLTPSNQRFSQSLPKKNEIQPNLEKELKPLNLKGNNYFQKKKASIVTEFAKMINKEEPIQKEQQILPKNSFSSKKQYHKEKPLHTKSNSVNKDNKINYHYTREKPESKFAIQTTEQKGILFGKMLNGYKGPNFSGPLGKSLF